MRSESNISIDTSAIYRSYEFSTPYQRIGKVHATKGLLYEANLSRAVIGSHVEFQTEFGTSCLGEVVGISGNKCFVMPYEDLSGINSETRIFLKELVTTVNVSSNMLGRVVDFHGMPIDGKGPIVGPFETRSIYAHAQNPLDRPLISERIDAGIHAIDGFMNLGKGQRMAIMAGSGVGKSVLLGMIARNTTASVNVIALIGERGREVLEFLKDDLGEEGLKRSVVVVATSDTSPLIRLKASYVATTISEYFRDQGQDVMLMMDSVTRFAMAAREIGLSMSEPPGQKGYPPSVFSRLPKLLERAGTSNSGGSITGIYTVLVEGGDMDEPITDAIRAISDGHITLSRDLAAQNHYPAIDVLNSLSRVAPRVVDAKHKVVANYLRELLAAYKSMEDLIQVGAYAKGSHPKVDKALYVIDDINSILKQDRDFGEMLSYDALFDRLVEIVRKAEEGENQEDREIKGNES